MVVRITPKRFTSNNAWAWFIANFFSPGKQAGPRVVHQNVDPARHIENLVDRRRDRCVICHVAGDHRNPIEGTRDGAPAGAEHAESSLVQRLCGGLPKFLTETPVTIATLPSRRIEASSMELIGVAHPSGVSPGHGDNIQLFVTEPFLNTSSPAYPTA